MLALNDKNINIVVRAARGAWRRHSSLGASRVPAAGGGRGGLGRSQGVVLLRLWSAAAGEQRLWLHAFQWTRHL